MRRFLPSLLVVVAVILSSCGKRAEIFQPRPAPKWALKDVNGQTVSSEQFKGKVVVIDFWATWCGPCLAEIPGYVELQKKYAGEGVAIVGISLDQQGPEVVKEFIARSGVNYQIVMGDDTVADAFGGVTAIPTTFIIDRTGTIRDRKSGAESTEDFEKRILAVLKRT